MIKIENWNGHDIRFIENEPGDWWAVLADVAAALNLRTDGLAARMEKGNISTVTLPTAGGPQEMNIVNEFGIYDAVFSSKKKEAREFKRWVYNVIKSLRQASGLEAFQVFRMLDKEHQKEAMKRLNEALYQPVRVDFIKANSIANKATSNRHGYPKMIKKGEMTSKMLVERQPILDDAVDLMTANERFGLGISVSDFIYKKHCG